MRYATYAAALVAALTTLTPAQAVGLFGPEVSVNADILEHTETIEETEGSVPPIVFSVYAYDELVGVYGGNRRPLVPVGPEVSYGIPPWGAITGPTRGAAFLRAAVREAGEEVPRVGRYDKSRDQIMITYDDLLVALGSGMLAGQTWLDGGTRRETNSYRIAIFFEVNQVKHTNVIYSRAGLLEFDRGYDYGQLWGVAREAAAKRLNARKIRERCAFLHLMGSGVVPVGPGSDGLMMAMDQFARWRSEAYITQYNWEDGQGKPAVTVEKKAPSLRMLVHYFRPEDVDLIVGLDGQLQTGNARPQFWTIPGSGLEWHTFKPGEEPQPPPFLRDRLAGMKPVALVDYNCYPNESTFLVNQGDIGFLPDKCQYGILATNEGGLGWWRIDSPGGALCFYNVVQDAATGVPIAQVGYRQYLVVPGGAPEAGLSPAGLGYVTGRIDGQVKGAPSGGLTHLDVPRREDRGETDKYADGTEGP